MGDTNCINLKTVVERVIAKSSLTDLQARALSTVLLEAETPIEAAEEFLDHLDDPTAAALVLLREGGEHGVQIAATLTKDAEGAEAFADLAAGDVSKFDVLIEQEGELAFVEGLLSELKATLDFNDPASLDSAFAKVRQYSHASIDGYGEAVREVLDQTQGSDRPFSEEGMVLMGLLAQVVASIDSNKSLSHVSSIASVDKVHDCLASLWGKKFKPVDVATMGQFIVDEVGLDQNAKRALRLAVAPFFGSLEPSTRDAFNQIFDAEEMDVGEDVFVRILQHKDAPRSGERSVNSMAELFAIMGVRNMAGNQEVSDFLNRK